MARFRWRAPYFRSVPSRSRKSLGRLRHAEQEAPLGRFQHALLHHAQLDFQNLLELFGAQRMENHRLVDAVHEFRREFPLGRFGRRFLHLLIQPRALDRPEPWAQIPCRRSSAR